eukprot:augustus_masked-scaffold_39-processed-gene-2.89-mRNA-1 protein AED:1.00 eAED:1.00 QI:0/0/0/0/1/1/4/0/1303
MSLILKLASFSRPLDGILKTEIKEILDDKLEEPLRKKNLEYYLKYKYAGEIIDFLDDVRSYKEMVSKEPTKEKGEVVVVVDHLEGNNEVKKSVTKEEIVEQIKKVENTYLTVDSEREINISELLRKQTIAKIEEAIEDPKVLSEEDEVKKSDLFDENLFEEVEGKVMSNLAMDHKASFLRRATTVIISKEHAHGYFQKAVAAAIVAVSLTTVVVVVLQPSLILRLALTPIYFFMFNFYLIYYNQFCVFYGPARTYEHPTQVMGLISGTLLPLKKKQLLDERAKTGKMTNLVLEPRLRKVHLNLSIELIGRVVLLTSLAMVIVVLLPPDGLVISSSKGKWFFSKPPTGAAGAATYLAEELACNVSTVQSTSDRILKVVLQGTGKKKINVVNCYAPHCKLGFSRRSNANGKLLEGWLKLKGYSIVNHRHVTGKKGAKKHGTFYSRYDNTKMSEIDFFITNKPERIYLFKPRRDISSWIWQKEKFDHIAIMVEMRKFHRGKKRWEKTPQKDLSKLLSNEQLAQQLDHSITLELLKLKEEERDYEALTQIVPKLVKDLVPEQSNNTVEQRTSDQTRELLRKKNALWSTATTSEKKELVNAVKRSARRCKRNWYGETASRIQLLFEQNRTREAYALLNLVKPTTKSYARITKDDKGNKIDTCQRLKILSDYIASQQLPPIPKIHLTGEEKVHYCSPRYESTPEEHINSNPPLMDEVMVCIRKLKNNRATGVDCIYSEVFKASPTVQKILLREIQELLRKTSFRQIIKKYFCLGKIIHIYKQKGEKNSPGSYKPIALLNTAFKLTTKIIHNRLQPIINKLPSYQAGFRSGHSTINKIEILNNIVKKKLLQNTKLKLLFIDFQKAFDSVNHDFIQLSLKEHGVSSKLRKLIRVLYKNAPVKVSEGKHVSKMVHLRREVLQGDSLSPAIFILVLNSTIKRINTNTLANVEVEGKIFNYLAFAYDLVAPCENKNQISSFIEQLYKLASLSGLRINLSKTKILLTDEGYSLAGQIPDKTINKLLTNFFCEKCQRYFHREKSLKAHFRSRFWDGTLNRRRAGTLAVKDTKYIVQKMLQPVAESISVLAEEVQPVKEMKYLGAVFNSTGIAQEHVLSNFDKCEARLTKYREILSCNTLTRKMKRQLARSMVLAPGIYNLGNWPLNNDIKRKLNLLTRKINSILNNILLEQRRKYVEADDATTDKQVHILREAGINNHLEPKDPKYISPTKACRKLGLEEEEDIDAVPPIQDPPSHGPPQPIHLRKTYNVPGTGSRAPSKENYLEQAARYRGTAPARINPLTYVQELLGLIEISTS